jgi:hypothetical protein
MKPLAPVTNTVAFERDVQDSGRTDCHYARAGPGGLFV